MSVKVPIVSVLLLLAQQTVSSWAVSLEEMSTTLTNDTITIPVVLVSVGVLIIVCVVVLFMCTDCYNAEVDTSNHPACRGSKSGGGSGYYPANTEDVNIGVMESSIRSNEYVSPSSNNAPLPYTMIPTHIPEDSGFRGYQDNSTTVGYTTSATAGYTARNAGGMAGYSVSQATAPVRTGTHVNPMEPEEPPPPYGAAVHGYHGNG